MHLRLNEPALGSYLEYLGTGLEGPAGEDLLTLAKRRKFCACPGVTPYDDFEEQLRVYAQQCLFKNWSWSQQKLWTGLRS